MAACREVQWESDDPADRAAREATGAAFAALISAVFDVTHNAMWHLLVQPILPAAQYALLGHGEEELPPDLFLAMEKHWVDTLVEAIAGGDAQAARETVARLVRLPQEAEAAMRSTPVGEKPHIHMAG